MRVFAVRSPCVLWVDHICLKVKILGDVCDLDSIREVTEEVQDVAVDCRRQKLHLARHMLPTLSSLLRGNDVNAASITALRAARTQALTRHREHLDAARASTAAPKAFAELTGNLPQTTPGYSEHAGHYRRFLDAISKLLGGEAPSEEVSDAAAQSFRTLLALVPDTDAADGGGPPGLRQVPTVAMPSREAVKQARACLIRDCPSFAGLKLSDDELIKKLLSSHAPLSRWLKQHREAAKASARSPETKEGVASAASFEERTAETLGSRNIDGSGACTVALTRGAIDAYMSMLAGEDGQPEGAPLQAPMPSTAPKVPEPPREVSAAAASSSANADEAAAEEGSLAWVRQLAATT